MHLLAESYLHTLDPFALRITETFGLRWYGLAYVAGFLLAWGMIRWLSKRGRSPLPVIAVGDLMFHAVLGVLVGGRLGYAFFYDPSIITGFSPTAPWWDLLAINRGGMASHGGVIGVIVAMCLFGWRQGIPKLHVLDMVAWTCPVGLMLGRFANFINGELWGRPLPPSMQQEPPWWSIKYPEEIRFGAIDLDALRSMIGGDTTFHDGVIQAVREGRSEAVEALSPLLTAHWPSQVIQAIAEGPLLLAALCAAWWRPRRPGVIGALFLLAYGVQRTITEQFREPDSGVAIIVGLTRGQQLSLLMILAGIIAIIACARRSTPALGGLHP